MSKKHAADKDLENVVGGFNQSRSWYGYSLYVSQEEYNQLEECGLIVDGKLKNENFHKAIDYLRDRGFEGPFVPTMTGLLPFGADRNERREFVDISVVH